jgi:hypothetical protein
MAIYTELTVYKKSYDLLIELFAVYNGLPKSVKYTIGEKLQKKIVAMILQIYRANSSHAKVPFILKAREHLEVIRLLIRILFDLKFLGIKRMVMINKMIEEISKQLTGWQKYSEQTG